MPLLIWAIRRLRNKETVEQAVEALVQIGPRAVPRLAVMLMRRFDPHKTEADWTVRGAAQALGRIGDPSAIESLMEALDDWPEDVSQDIRDALGQFSTEEARQACADYDAQQQRCREARVLYVLGFQVDNESQETRADIINAGPENWLDHPPLPWNAWVLGADPQPVVCKATSLQPPPAAEMLWKDAANQSTVIVEGLTSRPATPVFITARRDRQPCTYRVEVQMLMTSYGQSPDVQPHGAWNKRNWRDWIAHWPDTTGESAAAQEYTEFAGDIGPDVADDLPISLSYDGHVISGVLRLDEALGEMMFTGDLYLSDAVPEIAPGTVLTRTANWRVNEDQDSQTIEVATILAAERLLDDSF